MADNTQAQIERLEGRITALESICTIILGQIVHGDPVAKESIARTIRAVASEITPTTEASKIAMDTYLKIAADFMGDFK